MSKNKEKHIVISGYYGFGNAGDEAILASMVQQFKKKLPGIKITALSEDPEKTAKELDIDSFDRKNFMGILGLFGKTDVLISGGGGLVQDVTGFNTVLYYLGIVQMAKLRGCKVMLYAQGLGPINLKKSEFAARIIMNNADIITYRDENSLALSESIGINKPEIHVTADPVFALVPAGEEKLAPLYEKFEMNTGKFRLGISLRPWETDNDYIVKTAQVADSYAEENDAEVFVFPFQKSQDLDVCKKMIATMKNRATLVDPDVTMPELMGLIGRMDMIVGMRLHSLIFAAACSVPAAGISYDPKVSSLMEMLGLPWVDVHKFSFEKLQERAAQVYLNRAHISRTMPDRFYDLKSRAEYNVELLKKLVE